ncbi:sodium/calcium exchanger 3-like [Pecten maximus]|uniref:sodium/calcium exchanger 3-like n=1 Tax=Pecten maximus TaxID=6579 RepID=UPI0014584DE2|nr:sodium/calcium exchanger 3-like [Pecten maximus]XP_033750333.1 sodium/calcium exchanger 3-like [Pecten maximus]XP_033750339.1 sodium/calcium exchanger 3-like [Pecten maximus]XP_033750347.1 sodium/calcium exchanger 3-like [Pecten maximus]XP_033750355.1 sodium/calcium exchanger 3-like [Pecten maximus]
MANITNTTDAPNATAFTLYNYKCSNKGILLPVINEFTWSDNTRAALYFIAMLWCFLGVSIIADIFMCAIERITSKTTKVRIPDEGMPEGYRELNVKVWNDTVANLSLLALGTSAPEILLSCIEVIGNRFVAGELGPSTIVGSASFNLLVISAICISCIPDGEVRKMKYLKVFGVTSFSCIFAYVWLVIVLIGISPNRVELWEAIVTLLFFPTLILVAYLADRDCCMKKEDLDASGMVGISLQDRKDPEETMALDSRTSGDASLMNLAKELGHEAREDGLPEDEAAKLAAAKIAENQSHGRMWYRINATRGITGGKRLVPHVLTSFQGIYNNIRLPEEERKSAKAVDHSEGGQKAVIEFTAASVSVLESEKRVRVGIRRYGNIDKSVTVRVETINGTAVAPEDYITFNEEVKFAAKDQLEQIYIEIVDDNEWEPDEFFFVKLIRFDDDVHDAALGNVSICQVTIINDDEPGKLEFAKPTIIATDCNRRVRIPVQRVNGADGHVSVKWETKDITAISGKEFEGGSGELLFDHGETNRTIDINILDSMKPERDESFQVELTVCDGGAVLGKISKCIVTIVSDEEFNGLVSRIFNLTKANLDYLQLEESTWVGQFRQAMNVNGGEIEEATFLDYILHFLTFFWKVLFAFLPPPKYWNGWPAFVLSLAAIGFMTAIIGDLAGIFGCLIGLPDSITAITFVALGTSVPDTFASKHAAVNEKTADSSVGNINGSNSVNVFLGIGLPWTIAAIYWMVKTGEDFHVPAGSLSFTVIIYTVAAIMAILFLILRRNLSIFGNAELGGPKIPKYVSSIFFVSLWVIYILLSSLQATGKITLNI